MRVRIWNSPRVQGALLFGLTLAVWHGTPHGTFQFDDYPAILSAPVGLAWRIRPLLALTWQWDVAVYGQQAAGFLAENLILHCLTALFVYALARRILSPLGAFLAGVAFALQPAHSEVIAYVSGRSTGLMALLILAALWLSNRAADSQRPALRRGLIGLSLVLFVAAVLVKEVALVFPLLLWVWGSVAERKPDLLRRVLPFAAAAGALAVGLAAIPRYRALAAWSIGQHGPLDGLAINLSALPVQLSLWLRPGALSVEHSLEDAALPLILAVAILAALVSIAWMLRHRAPLVTLAISWAGAALLPTQSLLAKTDVVTEKPLYLAWVGVALLIGAALSAAFHRLEPWPPARAALGLAVVGISLAAAAAVHQRVEIWSDPVRLWTDATRKAPGSSRAWNNLGNALRTRAPGEALVAVRRSVALDPSNTHALANLFNLEALCPFDCPAH